MNLNVNVLTANLVIDGFLGTDNRDDGDRDDGDRGDVNRNLVLINDQVCHTIDGVVETHFVWVNQFFIPFFRNWLRSPQITVQCDLCFFDLINQEGDILNIIALLVNLE